MIKREIINEVVNKIKARFRPQKIFLFGSYAWGMPDEDSDIDLFLIMDSHLRRDVRSRMIQKIFSDRTFPLDIIVYTPKEVENSLKRGNLFVQEILTKGALLHG